MVPRLQGTRKDEAALPGPRHEMSSNHREDVSQRQQMVVLEVFNRRERVPSRATLYDTGRGILRGRSHPVHEFKRADWPW